MQKDFGKVLENKFPEKVTPDPILHSGKRADYMVNVCGRNVYFEHKEIRDITSDIKTPLQNKSVELFEIPISTEKPRGNKTILDRIAGKILEECEQLLEKEPNVLVIEVSDPEVGPVDVEDAFRGVPNWETDKRHPYYPFRTREELNKILKISALIAYNKLCAHDLLEGKFYNNKENTNIPLLPSESSLLEDLICNKCQA